MPGRQASQGPRGIRATYCGTSVEIPLDPAELTEPLYVGWRQPCNTESDEPQVWYLEPGREPRRIHHMPHQSHGSMDWGDGEAADCRDLAYTLVHDVLRLRLLDLYRGLTVPAGEVRALGLVARELHTGFDSVVRRLADRWGLPVSAIESWLGRQATNALLGGGLRQWLGVVLDAPRDEIAAAAAGW